VRRLTVRRLTMWAGLLLVTVMPLTSCTGNGLEQAFAPDPQLEAGELEASAQLPPDFPQEIPQYPNAVLRSVTSEGSRETGETQVQTRWATNDGATQVVQFYQQALQQDGWTLESESDRRLIAQRQDLQVRLTLVDAATPTPAASDTTPSPSPNTTATETPQAETTEFTLSYGLASETSTAAGTTVEAVNESNESAGQDEPLTDSWTLRPSPSPDRSPDARPSPVGNPQRFADVNQAPAELQPYIQDLANLGVLEVTENPGEFKPNQTITRREYARWLVATNNALFSDVPSKQIRLAVGSDRPIFQDVPTSDPDFAAIQGLANTGLIPSPLSGSSTTVRFRPDEPLNREDLILWKVPLDTRQALPQASLDAIQQTWGFQDTAQIEPRAQKAVLADFQNSDLSNIRRAFGFTTLFQPKKPVTRAEAAAVLWHFGTEGEGISAAEAAR